MQLFSLSWSGSTEVRRYSINTCSNRRSRDKVLAGLTSYMYMLMERTGGFVSGTSSEENYHPRELLDRAIDLEQPFVFTSFK